MHHIKRNDPTWSVIAANSLKAANVGVHLVLSSIKKR
jgi:hypothetical protein